MCLANEPILFVEPPSEAITQLALKLDTEIKHNQELEKRFHWIDRFANGLLKKQEEERHQLCYDIHDGVAQNLVPVLHYLQLIETLPDNRLSEVRALTVKARLSLQKALIQVRAVINDLRVAELGGLSLTEAIQAELEHLQEEQNWQIEAELAEPDLPPEHLELIFRIIREGLNNIRWHAHTKKIALNLTNQPDGSFSVLLQDWGVGFDPAKLPGPSNKGGIGLIAMQKRAQDLDATLEINSTEGYGTTLLLTLSEEGGKVS